MGTESKYDVAVSFLYGDLAIARKLYDDLTPQFRVFLSEERQGELGGSDGVDRFTAAFRREALVVVVLYRKEWGTTRWTRIEETAIKDRWLDVGSDFLLVVNLEPSEAKPVWLPDSKLWMRVGAGWNLDNVVTAITLKARDAGAVPQGLTARDLAMREQRRIDAAREREGKLRSSEGVSAGEAELTALFDSIERIAHGVNSGAPSLQVTVKKTRDVCVLRMGRGSVMIAWNARYAYTVLGAGLIVREWDRPMGLAGEMFARRKEPNMTDEVRYAFDYASQLGWCWRNTANSEYLTTEDLADGLVVRAIENASSLDREAQRMVELGEDDDSFV